MDATSATSLAPLVPLSELEESHVGAYAAASPSARAPMFGAETFAAVPEEGAASRNEEEARVSFRGGRLTVAPAAAAAAPGPGPGPDEEGDDDEEGDALARALRLCHSAAETAAGVAERLRSRDAASVPVSPRGTAGAAVGVVQTDRRSGSGGETRFQTGQTGRHHAPREDRSGDENDAPTSPSLASSPRLAPSPSRPGSAFGERSVRSSLERFRRRRSAPDPEPAGSPAERPLPEASPARERRTPRTGERTRARAFTETEPSDEDLRTSVEDSESDAATTDAVLETLLEELLVEGDAASDVRRVADDAEEDASGSESDDAADDLRRAARVEALVAEMSATEARGSRLIGAEAFGRLYDALARRAEAAAAAAAAMRMSNQSESESESESESDSERSEEGVRFPDRSSSPPFGEPHPGWCATLGPFASSVTVAMTPRRDVTTRSPHSALGDVSSNDGADASERRREGKKKRSGRDRRRDDDANVRFAEAEVLALQYARLVSELEKVGRSREGTPEGDFTERCDCAVRLAAGGPTGK